MTLASVAKIIFLVYGVTIAFCLLIGLVIPALLELYCLHTSPRKRPGPAFPAPVGACRGRVGRATRADHGRPQPPIAPASELRGRWGGVIIWDNCTACGRSGAIGRDLRVCNDCDAKYHEYCGHDCPEPSLPAQFDLDKTGAWLARQMEAHDGKA